MRWNQAGMPGNAAELVRASPDGTLFGMRTSMGSEGHDMALITLYGNQAQVRNGGMGASLMLPSPDARAIYTSEGVFTTRLDKVYPTAGERFGIPGENANLTGSVAFLLPGQYRPFATLRDVEGVAHENLAYGGNPANKMHHDKRVHLIPDAKLLVTIPSTNDRLVLRRFDLDDLLAKSGVDYLLVTSQPPAAFKPGATYSYPVAVKSKKGGVKYKLESGPDGMKVAADGKLTWKVPAGFAAAEVDVILTVADSSGQEIFQTFKVGRNDNAAAGPGAEAPAPPPEEVKAPPAEVKPAKPAAVDLPAAAPSNPAGGMKPTPLKANREERALPSAVGVVC